MGVPQLSEAHIMKAGRPPRITNVEVHQILHRALDLHHAQVDIARDYGIAQRSVSRMTCNQSRCDVYTIFMRNRASWKEVQIREQLEKIQKKQG